jgi:ectoine hydroxylase-related dioxygenase (phytanoyl-CoA dioxygenase family)
MNSRKGITITSATFPPRKAADYRLRFYRDGFVVIPDVFSASEVQTLRRGVDRVFEEPKWRQTHNVYADFIAVRLFEVDPMFEDILAREPIIGLVESILGPDCHLIANNVVRNRPGEAIDEFHVDDRLFFPIGEGMVRHDPRLTMPVYLLTVQILLTDVPSIEYGATEYVPGSHYAGQIPLDKIRPTFEGKGPVPIFGKAGDIYLHNGQCWHRGAPNESDRTRYLLQLAYGMRWVSQRFYPFVNYQFPPGIAERADERRKRVLGFHAKGPYG